MAVSRGLSAEQAAAVRRSEDAADRAERALRAIRVAIQELKDRVVVVETDVDELKRRP